MNYYAGLWDYGCCVHGTRKAPAKNSQREGQSLLGSFFSVGDEVSCRVLHRDYKFST